MDTITDLLRTIDTLPAEDRDEAVAELESILEMQEGPRQVALGLLALDLVTFGAEPRLVPAVGGASGSWG